jgi:hypothetical protein
MEPLKIVITQRSHPTIEGVVDVTIETNDSGRDAFMSHGPDESFISRGDFYKTIAEMTERMLRNNDNQKAAKESK